MSKKVTTYKKDLLNMEVGSRIHYARKLHPGYLATASFLKANGLGQWQCSCPRYEKFGRAERIA